NTVTLFGAVVDDGLPATGTLSVAWTYLSGPSPVSFSSTNTPVTTVTLGGTGVYVFRLTGSDGEFTTNDTAAITLLPDPRIPPTVALTSPQNGAVIRVHPQGTNITLNASASDPDDPIAQVEFFRGTT